MLLFFAHSNIIQCCPQIGYLEVSLSCSTTYQLMISGKLISFRMFPHLYNGDKKSICLTVVRITTVNIRKALKKSVCHLVGTSEVF